MTHRGLASAAMCLVVTCSVAAGPLTCASASEASLKNAITSYGSRIDIAEGHVVTAVGEFKESKDPAPVEAAIAKSVIVLRGLRAKVALQAASAPRVKNAKRKIEGGLGELIVAYGQLEVAYNEIAGNPETANKEAASALALTHKGHNELVAGVNLLH